MEKAASSRFSGDEPACEPVAGSGAGAELKWKVVSRPIEKQAVALLQLDQITRFTFVGSLEAASVNGRGRRWSAGVETKERSRNGTPPPNVDGSERSCAFRYFAQGTSGREMTEGARERH